MKMKFEHISIRNCALCLALGFTALSCNKDKTPLVLKGDCATPQTYATMKPILTTYCGLNQGACHGVGSGVGNYNTFEGLKKYTADGSFRKRVLVDKDMPPEYSTGPQSISLNDLKLIQCWSDNNFPEK